MEGVKQSIFLTDDCKRLITFFDDEAHVYDLESKDQNNPSCEQRKAIHAFRVDKLPTNLCDDPYNLYCLFSPDFESHIDIDPIERSFVIRDSYKGVIYHKIPSTYLSFDINKQDEIKL